MILNIPLQKENHSILQIILKNKQVWNQRINKIQQINPSFKLVLLDKDKKFLGNNQINHFILTYKMNINHSLTGKQVA